VIASKLLQCETITNIGVGLVDPTLLSFADLTFPFGVALESAWQPLRHTDANVSKPTSVPNRISRTSRAPRAVLAPTRLAPRPDGGVERAHRALSAPAPGVSPPAGSGALTGVRRKPSGSSNFLAVAERFI
jgi:hypothetical protein